MASAASALFVPIVKSLTFDGPDIDTWVYKFYSRVTVGLFFVAGAASVFEQIVGAKITCSPHDSYDETWCYFYGVGHLKPGDISEEMSGGSVCISNSEKISNYYLWISLVLFLCGAAFAIPNEIWKHFEGGLIKQFEGLKTMELETDNRKKLAEHVRTPFNTTGKQSSILKS